MKKIIGLFLFACLLSSPAHSGFHAPAGGGGSGTDLTGTQIDNNLTRGNGTDTVQSSGIDIDDSDNLTGANSINLADDKIESFGTGGTVSLIYETADADANLLQLLFPEGGATDVPVFLVGDTTLSNVDIGQLHGQTDPTIIVASDDGANFLRLKQGSTGGQIGTSFGGIEFNDRDATTGGYMPSFLFSPGDRATLTPGFSDFTPLVDFDLSANQTFSAGTNGLSVGFLIQPQTYVGTAPGTDFFGAVTFAVSGCPEYGANATPETCLTAGFGNPLGWTTPAATGIGAYFGVPGISDGATGDVNTRNALSISGPVSGGSVSLGDQNITLHGLTGIQVESIEFDSVGLVTVDIVSGIEVTEPQAQSGNVTVTDGPYAIHTRGNIRVDKENGTGFVLSLPVSQASATDLVITSAYTTLTNTTTIERISTPMDNLNTTINIECNGATTVTDGVASGGGFSSIKTIGGLGISCTADDVMTFSFNGTVWKQLGIAVM